LQCTLTFSTNLWDNILENGENKVTSDITFMDFIQNKMRYISESWIGLHPLKHYTSGAKHYRTLPTWYPPVNGQHMESISVYCCK